VKDENDTNMKKDRDNVAKEGEHEKTNIGDNNTIKWL